MCSSPISPHLCNLARTDAGEGNRDESIHNYHLPYLVKKGAISVHGACAIKILVQDKRLDKLRDANWIGERMEKRSLREITA